MISGDEIVEPVRSRNIAAQPARVAKLADAGGLNPPSIHVEYGFKSRPGHLYEEPLRVLPKLASRSDAAG